MAGKLSHLSPDICQFRTDQGELERDFDSKYNPLQLKNTIQGKQLFESIEIIYQLPDTKFIFYKKLEDVDKVIV